MTRAWLLAAVAVAIAAGCSKKRQPAGDEAGSGSSFRAPDGGIDRAAVAAAYDQKCVAGDSEACRSLGILYQSGTGVAVDRQRAVALFGQACNRGNLAACNHLAMALTVGAGIAADRAQAVAVYQKACDGGYGPACNNLGLMLRGEPAERARAEAMFDRACTANVPVGCTNAGNLDAMLVEKEGAPRVQKMVKHYQRGCDGGEASSCRQLGVLYLDGFGLPKSAGAAGVWLKKGCDRDDAIACRVLGLLHRDGAGVPRDPDRSAQLLKRACDRNDTEACKLAGIDLPAPASREAASPAPPISDPTVTPDASTPRE